MTPKALQDLITNVGAELDAAKEAAEPYEKDFRQRHHDCADLWERRRQGELIPKDTMLAAYDRRMAAGQACHPHRQQIRQLKDWLKSLEQAQPKKKRATMRQHALSL